MEIRFGNEGLALLIGDGGFGIMDRGLELGIMIADWAWKMGLGIGILDQASLSFIPW